MAENRDFEPDWVSAPGDTIADILEQRNLSLLEFADRIGSTLGYADELLRGHVNITIETARQLETVLGASEAFWVNRESQYREDLARLKRGACEVLEDWLSELPLREMARFGWLESGARSGDKLAECLRFFGVPDVATWRE